MFIWIRNGIQVRKLMGKRGDKIIVEAAALRAIASGSLEERLQQVFDVVDEHGESFFGGPARLFATHTNRVTVYVEDQGFFSSEYKIQDGKAVLVGIVRQERVLTVNEDMLAKRAVNDFFNSGTFSPAIVSLISATSGVNDDATKTRIDSLVGESVWRSYVLGGDVDGLRGFLADDDLFEVSDKVSKRFCSPSSDINVSNLVASLTDMSRRIAKMTSCALEKVDFYQGSTGKTRTEEEDNILSKFDSIAGSFLENIDGIADIISDAIRRAKDGDVKGAAAIHDGIAKDFKNIHLGHRFVSKMAAQLAKV
jgi:hypothetical protein